MFWKRCLEANSTRFENRIFFWSNFDLDKSKLQIKPEQVCSIAYFIVILWFDKFWVILFILILASIQLFYAWQNLARIKKRSEIVCVRLAFFLTKKRTIFSRWCYIAHKIKYWIAKLGILSLCETKMCKSKLVHIIWGKYLRIVIKNCNLTLSQTKRKKNTHTHSLAWRTQNKKRRTKQRLQQFNYNRFCGWFRLFYYRSRFLSPLPLFRAIIILHFKWIP